jgi:NADPH2:quinone reductase
MPLAVVVDVFGPPDTFALREVPSKPLRPGEVRIALKAAGVSFVDVLAAAGRYQVKPPLPFVPGSEGAGVISEVGSEVATLKAGDRVVVSGWGGMFAEETVVPERTARRMPDSMNVAEAAVFPVSYATAWHALVDRARLRVGETVLVLGAGGATGFAAVQVARHLGARVIGSASSAAKRTLAAAGGAHRVVESRRGDWREQVRVASAGRPIDVVFDPVGGDMTETAFRCLGWGGRHLVVGFTAGLTALRTNLALVKGASLVGVDIRQFGELEPDMAAANTEGIFALAARGALRAAVARRFPLEAFHAAMAEAASGETAGRVVLEIG